MQQQLFSNSISMGLSGKLGSNGFMYATPLPMMVCLGVNDVLLSHKVKDTTPVFPGSICILFLSVESKSVEGIICVLHNLAMRTIEPWMFALKLGHRDIPSHTLML